MYIAHPLPDEITVASLRARRLRILFPGGAGVYHDATSWDLCTVEEGFFELNLVGFDGDFNSLIPWW
jgi:hypothetical protein